MDMENAICSAHLLNLGNLCPQCAQFLCSSCECPHFPKQRLIPLWYINKYLKTLKMPTLDQINGIKAKLTDTFNSELTKLQSAFAKTLESLNSFVGGKNDIEEMKASLMEMGVSDKSFAVIHSLEDKKAKSVEDNPVNSFESCIYKIINKISSISRKLEDQLNFLKTPQLSETASIIHYWSNNTITMEDMSNSATKVFKLNGSINIQADSIICMNRIFIMGGSGPISDTYEVDLKNSTLMQKCPMEMKKCSHSLCKIDTLIFSIGGYVTTATNDCEQYNILKDKWRKLPGLITARYLCAAFSFNKRYIYAFGGTIGQGTLNSLEKLDMREPTCWKVIEVSSACSARGFILGIQISNSEVIIFGGHTNESYLLRISENSVICKKHSNLPTSYDFFSQSAPIFDGKCVYSVSHDRKVCKYSLDSQTWSSLH